MTSLTSENFLTEIRTPCVVHFWASWSGPCFDQDKVLLQLAIVNPEAKFGRLNVEENPDIAAEYGVFVFPTVILFKNGTPNRTFVGLTEVKMIHDAIGKL